MVAHFLKTGKRHGPVELRPENCIEVWALVVSSGWFLVILARGCFHILDGAVLLSIFVGYLLLLAKLPPEEEGKEDLLAPSIVLVELPRRVCMAVVSAIMVLGGATMILIANPFVDSMQEVAVAFAIPQFYFVQWVAPFLTEFPEKVTAFYWAKKVHTAPMALVNMVSSKVNQWTLLAAMVPIVYCFFCPKDLGPALQRIVPIEDQSLEIWLSVAMTMYGASCLLKRRFTGVNCAILFALWFVQFANPQPGLGLFSHFGLELGKLDMRRTTAWIFAGLAVAELAWHLVRGNLHPIDDLRETARLMREGARPHAQASK
jgi:cation:H+ antiporter